MQLYGGKRRSDKRCRATRKLPGSFSGPTCPSAGSWTSSTISAPSSASGFWRLWLACPTLPTSACSTSTKAWAGGELGQSSAGYNSVSSRGKYATLSTSRSLLFCLLLDPEPDLSGYVCFISSFSQVKESCCWLLSMYRTRRWPGALVSAKIKILLFKPAIPGLTFASARCYVTCDGGTPRSAWSAFATCLSEFAGGAGALCRGVERATPPPDHGVPGRRPVLGGPLHGSACSRLLLLGPHRLLRLLPQPCLHVF